jgi:hypothetical protein
MKEWKDVVPSIVSALGSDAGSHACILEFLRVLPEEVTEGRKITLTVRGPKRYLSAGVDIRCAISYQNQSLMHHIRKKS